MKTNQPVNRNNLSRCLISFPLMLGGLVMSNTVMAQSAVTTNGSSIIPYLLVIAALCLLCATVLVIRRAYRVLDEYGQSIFDFDSTVFKNMAENSRDVTIFIVVIVLIGVYLVLSYGS